MTLQSLNATLVKKITNINNTVSNIIQILNQDLKSIAQIQKLDNDQIQVKLLKESFNNFLNLMLNFDHLCTIFENDPSAYLWSLL